jgi:hypothetical protein
LAQYPRWLSSSYSPPWEPETSQTNHAITPTIISDIVHCQIYIYTSIHDVSEEDSTPEFRSLPSW